jgi:hypothetical protein
MDEGGQVWHNSNPTAGGAWLGWFPIADPANSASSKFSLQAGPSAIARSAQALDVFVMGEDRRVWRKSWHS